MTALGGKALLLTEVAEAGRVTVASDKSIN
jgi:hypothetical protein